MQDPFIDIYPHLQHPLNSYGGLVINNQKKEHLMELCSKCQYH